MNASTHPSAPSEQAIQHAAYFLWEGAGCPAGRDLEFWLTAKELLRHRVHVPAPAPARRRRSAAQAAKMAADASKS